MIKKSTKKIFILGTDTEVGKTVIARSLARTLFNQKFKIGVFKPLESGGVIKNGKLYGLDSQSLKEAAFSSFALDMINPYILKNPLAPGVAAEIENIKISFPKIKKSFEKIVDSSDFTIVEGAGGLLVPIQNKKTNLDLIKYLDIDVLLVARSGLGTINHTLLTFQHLSAQGINVRGVILNQVESQRTLSEKTNIHVLKKYGVPIWGYFPHILTNDTEILAQEFSKRFLKYLPNYK